MKSASLRSTRSRNGNAKERSRFTSSHDITRDDERFASRGVTERRSRIFRNHAFSSGEPKEHFQVPAQVVHRAKRQCCSFLVQDGLELVPRKRYEFPVLVRVSNMVVDTISVVSAVLSFHFRCL